jgi:hypothetical protein
VYVENSYLNCYDIVPINIVRLIGQGYLKFLPLNVTNLNKSWPIDKHGNVTGEKRPIVSMINDSSVTKLSPKKSVFPRSLETLKRPGVNITSFSSPVDGEGI